MFVATPFPGWLFGVAPNSDLSLLSTKLFPQSHKVAKKRFSTSLRKHCAATPLRENFSQENGEAKNKGSVALPNGFLCADPGHF
jgi:hypothetical protein